VIIAVASGKAAGNATVVVSLTLSFHETQWPDCDVAFVEMREMRKRRFLGAMGQVM
jgi:MinD superfamily P-loop ATPase